MTRHRWMRRIGNTVAPPRFVLFALVFAISSAAFSQWLEPLRVALLLGFDLATLVFLIVAAPLMNNGPTEIRRTAEENDANRAALLGLTMLITVVILIAVGALIADPNASGWKAAALVVVTLLLSWLFANTIFMLHYAHLYYGDSGSGDRGGLEFPSTKDPDYWDFAYFSFNLGMTLQTSDVAIRSRRLRRVVLAQCFAAFLFNIGVIAFTVNALGGG